MHDEIGRSANVREQRTPAVGLDPLAAGLPGGLIGYALCRGRRMQPCELPREERQVVFGDEVKFAQSPIALFTWSAMNPIDASRYAALNIS